MTSSCDSFKDCVHDINAESYSVGASRGTPLGKDIGLERGHPTSLSIAAGSTRICFIVKIGMMIISKTGMESVILPMRKKSEWKQALF